MITEVLGSLRNYCLFFGGTPLLPVSVKKYPVFSRLEERVASKDLMSKNLAAEIRKQRF